MDRFGGAAAGEGRRQIGGGDVVEGGSSVGGDLGPLVDGVLHRLTELRVVEGCPGGVQREHVRAAGALGGESLPDLGPRQDLGDAGGLEVGPLDGGGVGARALDDPVVRLPALEALDHHDTVGVRLAHRVGRRVPVGIAAEHQLLAPGVALDAVRPGGEGPQVVLDALLPGRGHGREGRQRDRGGELGDGPAQREDDGPVVGSADRVEVFAVQRAGVSLGAGQIALGVVGSAREVRGEGALDVVLDVAGEDRGAVLVDEAGLQGEGPGAASVGGSAEVGREVGDDLAAPLPGRGPEGGEGAVDQPGSEVHGRHDPVAGRVQVGEVLVGQHGQGAAPLRCAADDGAGRHAGLPRVRPAVVTSLRGAGTQQGQGQRGAQGYGQRTAATGHGALLGTGERLGTGTGHGDSGTGESPEGLGAPGGRAARRATACGTRGGAGREERPHPRDVTRNIVM